MSVLSSTATMTTTTTTERREKASQKFDVGFKKRRNRFVAKKISTKVFRVMEKKEKKSKFRNVVKKKPFRCLFYFILKEMKTFTDLP